MIALQFVETFINSEVSAFPIIKSSNYQITKLNSIHKTPLHPIKHQHPDEQRDQNKDAAVHQMKRIEASFTE